VEELLGKIENSFHRKWRGVNWGVNSAGKILNPSFSRPLHFHWSNWKHY